MARKDLARVLDDPVPWTPLHELAVDPPADLVAVIRDSYVAAGISLLRTAVRRGVAISAVELVRLLNVGAAPLLTGLRTGHYLAAVADLDLEHVTDPGGSWWWRRLDRRSDDDGWFDGVTPETHWPGIDHFQLRSPISGPRPTYGVVLPTRPLGTTSAETIAAHADAIDQGARPPCCWPGSRTATSAPSTPNGSSSALSSTATTSSSPTPAARSTPAP